MLLVMIQICRRGSVVNMAVGGLRNFWGRGRVCVVALLMCSHDFGRILAVSHKIELLQMLYGTQGQSMHGHREEKVNLSTAAQILAKGLKLGIGVPM